MRMSNVRISQSNLSMRSRVSSGWSCFAYIARAADVANLNKAGSANAGTTNDLMDTKTELKIVTDTERERGCECCGDLGFHVTVADGWRRADSPTGEDQPRENCICVMRCDELEKYANDSVAALAAKTAGIDCSAQWPYYVSAEGLATWRQMLGMNPEFDRQGMVFDHPKRGPTPE